MIVFGIWKIFRSISLIIATACFNLTKSKAVTYMWWWILARQKIPWNHQAYACMWCVRTLNTISLLNQLFMQSYFLGYGSLKSNFSHTVRPCSTTYCDLYSRTISKRNLLDGRKSVNYDDISNYIQTKN